MAELIISITCLVLVAGIVRWAIRERRMQRLTKRLEPFNVTKRR